MAVEDGQWVLHYQPVVDLIESEAFRPTISSASSQTGGPPAPACPGARRR